MGIFGTSCQALGWFAGGVGVSQKSGNGERAVLVHLYLPADEDREDLAEFFELADSAGAQAVATITATRASPDAKYFVGSGKAAEIRDTVQQEQADLVLFNHADRFAQWREVMGAWMAEGRLQYRVDMLEGFANLPHGLMRLFTGENVGKQLIRLEAAPP